jgi:uncharacterized protein YjbJ (UPF0337 family)
VVPLFNELMCKVKDVIGNVIGNRSTELKGLTQKIAGKIQSGYGDAKADLKRELKLVPASL